MGENPAVRFFSLKLPMKLSVLLLFLFLGASMPYRAWSPDGFAEPYRFSLARWEVTSFISALWHRLTLRVSPQEVQEVRDYFSGRRRISLRRVEVILAKQIESVLRKEGLSFPPVFFRISSPPHVLIISPRHKIELKQTILLRQKMSVREMEVLEARVSRLGVSALVEPLGGVATYPSMIGRWGLQDTIAIIAHEWLHHYFFFHPLGRAYNKNPDMTTINETAAELASKEIADRVLMTFYGERWRERKTPRDIYFERKMRYIRLTVEELLKRGKIEEAERFMEEQRLELVRRGYNIRKLNQAYFAFHGTYAESPQAISPIAEELKLLRRKSPSLGAFIRTVAGLSSYEQLRKLLDVDSGRRRFLFLPHSLDQTAQP